MEELLVQYFSSMQTLCSVAGAIFCDNVREKIKEQYANKLCEEQLENGIRIYEYHTRRILADNSRLETEEMIKNFKRNQYTGNGYKKRKI